MRENDIFYELSISQHWDCQFGSDVTKQKDSALNIVYVFKHDENIKDKMVS